MWNVDSKGKENFQDSVSSKSTIHIFILFLNIALYILHISHHIFKCTIWLSLVALIYCVNKSTVLHSCDENKSTLTWGSGRCRNSSRKGARGTSNEVKKVAPSCAMRKCSLHSPAAGVWTRRTRALCAHFWAAMSGENSGSGGAALTFTGRKADLIFKSIFLA